MCDRGDATFDQPRLAQPEKGALRMSLICCHGDDGEQSLRKNAPLLCSLKAAQGSAPSEQKDKPHMDLAPPFISLETDYVTRCIFTRFSFTKEQPRCPRAPSTPAAHPRLGECAVHCPTWLSVLYSSWMLQTSRTGGWRLFFHFVGGFKCFPEVSQWVSPKTGTQRLSHWLE